MKKTILALSISLLAKILFAQTSVSVNVTAAGGFRTAFYAAGGNRATTTNLTVTGNIDARDVKYMRDSMTVLTVLDLEAIQIQAYSGTGGTYKRTYYPANTIPYFSFCYTPIYAGKTTLTNIILPRSIQAIDDMAFYGCTGLSGNLVLPNSVTRIGVNSFINSGYMSVFIPNSVTSIGEDAFMSCNQLLKVVMDKSVPIEFLLSYNNSGIKKTCELVVPFGSKTVYQQNESWKLYTNITEAIFITLNTQGGNSVLPITTSLTNSTIAAPTNPVREGYLFAGWYKDAACTNAWNFATDVVTAPITLYAKWTNTSTRIENQQFVNCTLYPNPAATSLHLNNIPQNARMKIFNTEGKLMKQHYFTERDDIIDVESFPNGVYILTIESKDGKMYRKFVKQ